MHKFSGIYMGRRRKQTCEPEADMEGSSEDSELEVLASFAKDLQQSILPTESALAHHLQENQEAMRKGQSELKETLERVNASQDKILWVLLHLTHGGKGPEIYANREASGSHGETRHQ
jgi:hypothetical protein